MMDRLEMMTSNSEQIVNRAVDTEKLLEFQNLYFLSHCLGQCEFRYQRDN